MHTQKVLKTEKPRVIEEKRVVKVNNVILCCENIITEEWRTSLEGFLFIFFNVYYFFFYDFRHSMTVTCKADGNGIPLRSKLNIYLKIFFLDELLSVKEFIIIMKIKFSWIKKIIN